MPTDYKCAKCGLRFSLGPYHGNMGEGYAGARLSVCRACGTQHRLRFALQDRGPEYFPLYDLVIESVPYDSATSLAQYLRLSDKTLGLAAAMEKVRNLPATILTAVEQHRVDAMEKKLRTIKVTSRKVQNGQRRNSGFGEVQPDQLHYSVGPQYGEVSMQWRVQNLAIVSREREDRPKESDFSCMVCAASQSLVCEIEDLGPCPSCKDGELVEVTFWLT